MDDMADDIEAPKRIWIEEDSTPYYYQEDELHDAGSPVTEYIRADLVAAERERLKAENERLRLQNEELDFLRHEGGPQSVSAMEEMPTFALWHVCVLSQRSETARLRMSRRMRPFSMAAFFSWFTKYQLKSSNKSSDGTFSDMRKTVEYALENSFARARSASRFFLKNSSATASPFMTGSSPVGFFRSTYRMVLIVEMRRMSAFLSSEL